MTNTDAGDQPLYRQVKRGRVSDQVVAQLRQLISQGTLKVGQQLPSENDLAEKFSTSRPTIREALRTLETLGMVEIKTGSGAFVIESPFRAQNLSESLKWLIARRETVLQLLAVREVLQGLGARLCAEGATPDQIERLHGTLREMAQAKETDDPEMATAADTQFHYLIGEFSANAILSDLIRAVEQSYRSSSRALMDLGGRAMASVMEHAAVLEAVSAHDGPLAELQMRAHVASVRSAVVALAEEAQP
jgi:GntR family transcriptional repressor for pyruvate dehydrogenase complex